MALRRADADATEEAWLKQAVVVLALLSSAASFLVLCGGGGALFVIPNSGERGTGALLAFCGVVAFASVVVLVFAGEKRFQEQTWRAGAVAAAVIGAMAPAGIAAAAFRFAGLPVRSQMPLVDWPIFFAGVFFLLGALAILALGYLRARTEVEADPEIIHMDQIRDAQLQLRAALKKASSVPQNIEDDEVRVRRV